MSCSKPISEIESIIAQIQVNKFSPCLPILDLLDIKYLPKNIDGEDESITYYRNKKIITLVRNNANQYKMSINHNNSKKNTGPLVIMVDFTKDHESIKRMTLSRVKPDVKSIITFSNDSSIARLKNKKNYQKKEFSIDYKNKQAYYDSFIIPESYQVDPRLTEITDKDKVYAEILESNDDKYVHKNKIVPASNRQIPQNIEVLKIISSNSEEEINSELLSMINNYQQLYMACINHLGEDIITTFTLKKLLTMTECPTINHLDCFSAVPRLEYQKKHIN